MTGTTAVRSNIPTLGSLANEQCLSVRSPEAIWGVREASVTQSTKLAIWLEIQCAKKRRPDLSERLFLASNPSDERLVVAARNLFVHGGQVSGRDHLVEVQQNDHLIPEFRDARDVIGLRRHHDRRRNFDQI